MARRYAILTAVLTFALALRLVFVVTRDRPLFSDEIDYDRLGRTLAATGSYSEHGAPTAYRTIGYPAFLACVYAAAGAKSGPVAVAQAALGTASCGLLYAVAGGGVAGLWAAGIWAVYPSAILYTDLVMPETLFVFVLLAALLVWRRSASVAGSGAGAEAGAGARVSLTLGALLGVLSLIKPQAVVLLAALPLVAKALGARAPRWGLVMVAASLVLLPWVARNFARLGRPTLVTSVGANLLIGNNPFATGGYSVRIPPDMRPTAREETVAEDQAIEEATTYIAGHPVHFVKRGIQSMAHLVATEAGMVVWGFHPSPGVSKARLREKIREVPVGEHLAISGSYAVLLLTGILGALAAPRDDLKVALIAMVASWLAVHFVFYGGSRYHFPVMPLFALYAGRLAARAQLGPGAVPGTITRRGWAAFVILAAGLFGVWAGEYWVFFRQ